MPRQFLIVQPWTQHLTRRFIDATVVSEHDTVEDAYAALDAIAERMAAHGGKSDAVNLFIVDDRRRPVIRPNLH